MTTKLAGICFCVLAPLPGLCANWNARLAADFLDSRQKEWQAWPGAKISDGTCFSCHTGMTYMLARPALRRALGEAQPTPWETELLAGLRTRVEKTTGAELAPRFAKEPRASQAVGVESIFAALFLQTEPALDRMWSLRDRSGKPSTPWAWFSTNLDPWEMPQSAFFGAALAALATGTASRDYRNRPEMRDNVAALAEYFEREEAAQPLHHRLALLWASARLPEVLAGPQRQSIIDAAWRAQAPDGGWSMEALGGWKQRPDAPPSAGSNSYATGFAAFALQKAGAARKDARLTRALEWLKARQDRQSGAWTADSMNKVYEPGSIQVKFMQDAATAFAALALVEAGGD